jgi:hypothetical protein
MKSIAKIMAGAGVVVILSCAPVVLLHGQQKSVSVEGYVLDSACAFTKDLEKPISRDCALKCAKGGSKLVILADDGAIYWPITRLLEFAGGRVTATGKLYDSGGSHALVIEQIVAAPAKKSIRAARLVRLVVVRLVAMLMGACLDVGATSVQYTLRVLRR